MRQNMGSRVRPSNLPAPEVPYFASQDRPVARSATRASPNTMRYQANTSNERCDTKRTSQRTTTSALANATTKPIAKISASDPDKRWRFSHGAGPVGEPPPLVRVRRADLRDRLRGGVRERAGGGPLARPLRVASLVRRVRLVPHRVRTGPGGAPRHGPILAREIGDLGGWKIARPNPTSHILAHGSARRSRVGRCVLRRRGIRAHDGLEVGPRECGGLCDRPRPVSRVVYLRAARAVRPVLRHVVDEREAAGRARGGAGGPAGRRSPWPAGPRAARP